MPDCEKENIKTNLKMPGQKEDRARYYQFINGHPALKINQSCFEISSVDISKRFKSEYEWFCKFIDYRISKVQVILPTGSTILPNTMYKNIMSINS